MTILRRKNDKIAKLNSSQNFELTIRIIDFLGVSLFHCFDELSDKSRTIKSIQMHWRNHEKCFVRWIVFFQWFDAVISNFLNNCNFIVTSWSGFSLSVSKFYVKNKWKKMISGWKSALKSDNFGRKLRNFRFWKRFLSLVIESSSFVLMKMTFFSKSFEIIFPKSQCFCLNQVVVRTKTMSSSSKSTVFE